MSSNSSEREVVITGIGVISPIGIGVDPFWESLAAGRGGISRVSTYEVLASPDSVGGEIKEFNDNTARKIYLKEHRKSLKVMCREIQLGVASASLAQEDAKLNLDEIDHERLGVEFGANLMLSTPDVLKDACRSCLDEPQHEFQFERWGSRGLGSMEPLWLLRYLPNMPACHIGIQADARGPNNSLTLEDASGNTVLSEAYRVLIRGSADVMITGTTGTTLHPFKTIHQALWYDLATEPDEPAKRCRPFDLNRTGRVVAEGACTFILEDRAHAEKRGAKIYARLLGFGSSCVVNRDQKPNPRQALVNAMRAGLRSANMRPEQIGHINAHGLGTKAMDLAEAQAIQEVFGEYASKVPVTALKSYLGNSGAGSGTLELAGSIVSLNHGVIPPTLNYETPDPDCPLNVVSGAPRETANKLVLKTNVTRMGQAAAVVVEAL